jgi:hypothetical protein
MSFRVVLVRLAVFLISGGLMRAVAERLILRKTAHANPDRFLLGLNFKGPLISAFLRIDQILSCEPSQQNDALR